MVTKSYKKIQAFGPVSDG